jgi:hypothetical protein
MSPRETVFLISPANLGGKRGKQLLSPEARFDLARQLRSPAGARLGEVFTFVSSLYFRGKMAYAERFGHALGGPAAYVMTAGGGLCTLNEPVSVARLEGWQRVSVSEHNPQFTAPLIRHVCELSDALGTGARFVLLGSVASRKYVAPLLEALGPRLLFPSRLAGLGDMSRGALLLRCVSANEELAYESLQPPHTKVTRCTP